jgi:diacylglycerol kinase family enzyme
VAEQGALVTVANVETYGGFLTLTPAASPFDGLLDVCILPRVSKRRLFAHLFALFLNLPGRWRNVQQRRGSHVAVSVNGGAWDELQVSAGALHLVVPPRRLATLPRQGTLCEQERRPAHAA